MQSFKAPTAYYREALVLGFRGGNPDSLQKTLPH